MKIYIVGGTTGEYSDRSDWNVCAYKNEDRAEEHVRKAMLRAKELQGEYGRYSAIPKGSNEFDPDMQMDYTGTEYYFATVELID